MHPSLRFVVEQVLLPSLLTFLLVGGVFGIVVGAGLFTRSARVLGWIDTLNHWVSFRRVLKPVEAPHDSWNAVQRNRRWLSVVLMIGAVYTVAGLHAVSVDDFAASIAERFSVPAIGVAWILTSIRWFLVLGNVIAIAISAMLAFAPAPLARLDGLSNRWISTRSNLKEASAMHCTFDHWVEHWPRTTGGLIALFSVVEVVCVARVL